LCAPCSCSRRITSAPDVRCGSESPLLFLVFGIVVLTSWCLPLPLVETFADGDMLASCGGRERNEFDFYSARSLTRLQAPPVSHFYSFLLHDALRHMRALCVLPRPTATSTRSEIRPLFSVHRRVNDTGSQAQSSEVPNLGGSQMLTSANHGAITSKTRLLFVCHVNVHEPPTSFLKSSQAS
jgi:hypothetical protein